MLVIPLSELASSFAWIALILGAGLVIPQLLDRQNSLHRAFLFGIAGLLSLRYLWWRVTVTLAPPGWTVDFVASSLFLLIEAAAVLSSLSAFMILSRTRDRKEEATNHADWWDPEAPPRVAILIATYNEEREVLERTIAGAKSAGHLHKDVLILDDGRRDWLRDFAVSQGVRYVRRPDNSHAKAGNINHALRLLAADPFPPQFVAVLDADFVPHRDFLKRALALFHEPDVGLVQTPQHFFNADPIQHNLGLSRSYPDEQRFFFDHLQPSRDAWGIAFCCGTSSVIRWSALEAAGGFPTESVTEDFMLTLALQDQGYRTVYLNEPLTEGLAPEGLKEYVTQRSRWCLGLMQIARSRLGPLSRNGLRLRDRWSVADSVLFWTSTFSFRLAAMIFPLLYWYFGVTILDASVNDAIRYFGPYFLWVMIILNFVSGGLVIPIVNDVSQLLGARYILQAAVIGLVRPKGHPFSVTAKGGDRNRIIVQWRLLIPFAALLALTLLGALIGILSDRFAFTEAGDGKLVILFWTFYNLFVLAVTIIVCIELPRRERHFGDKPERGLLCYDNEELAVWLTSLTQNTARIRGARLEREKPVTISIRDVGTVDAIVMIATDDGARLSLNTTPEQHDALLRRLYAEGGAPSVTQTRFRGLAADLGRRLSFSGPRP